MTPKKGPLIYQIFGLTNLHKLEVICNKGFPYLGPVCFLLQKMGHNKQRIFRLHRFCQITPCRTSDFTGVILQYVPHTWQTIKSHWCEKRLKRNRSICRGENQTQAFYLDLILVVYLSRLLFVDTIPEMITPIRFIVLACLPEQYIRN